MLAPIRIAFAFALVALNTAIQGPLLLLLAVNTWMIQRFTPTRIELRTDATLRYEGWYLVLCNHASWVDIPVLQAVTNRRIPALRFFLKQELIYVPILGLAWWALDFPFMKRHSRAEIEKNPALRGQDLEATRRACERYKKMPVSVMNFVEGTRFTQAKHDAQQSPFRNLLKPRAGGVGAVLDAMGTNLRSVLDATIVYPTEKPPTMFDLLAGRIGKVEVHIVERPIPQLGPGDYESDEAYRERCRQWINSLWTEKDALIASRRTGQA
jgi:1-acyl-sn-glycerol-3-phosphate acyltransferase